VIEVVGCNGGNSRSQASRYHLTLFDRPVLMRLRSVFLHRNAKLGDLALEPSSTAAVNSSLARYLFPFVVKLCPVSMSGVAC